MENIPRFELPHDLIEQVKEKNTNLSLLQRWNAFTALPPVSPDASFVRREAVRKSVLTSNVLFFFGLMVVSLLPACYLVISQYPSYFWLVLALAVSCVFGLILNRKGFTKSAGLLVTTTGFLSLTVGLFSTVPFDETTLQAYDMYVVAELLAVALLPTWSVFLVYLMSAAVILGTLFTMPLTQVLHDDLSTRLVLIVARPLGILILGAGVAYILANHLTNAIQRANRAETVARLEHELAEQRQSLQWEIDQLLQTHVEVANGNYGTRVPLSEDNKLWQIGRALNTLLVRYQRAALSEQQLKQVDRVVSEYVAIIQRAKRERHNPILPLTKTNLDPLIAELQGTLVQMSRPTVMADHPSSPSNFMESSPFPSHR